MKLSGAVAAVALDSGHRFSKRPRPRIDLIEGFGVEGDAHAGPYVKHRYLARRKPRMPNLRQVHLIAEEVLLAMRGEGFAIEAAQLGENITTRGLALEHLPNGTLLSIGARAAIELTGLRTPCVLIDRFRKGLKQKLVIEEGLPVPYRAGVLGVVRHGGPVSGGDAISVQLPSWPWSPLPPL